eukprot:8129510-Ditylum_brightwellii.AAC.1
MATPAYPQLKQVPPSGLVSVKLHTEKEVSVNTNLIDPSYMFDNLLEGAVAAEALKANAKLPQAQEFYS